MARVSSQNGHHTFLINVNDACVGVQYAVPHARALTAGLDEDTPTELYV